MKKFSLIMLTLFYLFASSGLMVCANHLKKFFSQSQKQFIANLNQKSCCHSINKKENVNPEEKDNCKDGCCKNGHCSVKVKGDGFSNVFLSYKLFSYLYISISCSGYPISLVNYLSIIIIPDYHAPPDYTLPLYLKYQTLKI